ncbi:Ger(x)C family spore germination protein [Paenibacillus sp. y28]|uniref:Ger(x)C family spore germination protein n=1 Tax=Paenibacillus sp. y28 TaxID=3129110 RepID=UPI003FA7D827
MDFFNRSGEARLSGDIYVARGKALDVLKTNPYFSEIPYESIREIGNITGLKVTLRRFLSDYYRKWNQDWKSRWNELLPRSKPTSR